MEHQANHSRGPILLRIYATSIVCLQFAGCDILSDGHPLKSKCVDAELELSHDLADGSKCSTFSYGDCARGSSSSECINFCAHSLCQPAECITDADCIAFGNATCQEYVVSGTDYGRWCKKDSSSGGSGGCDCLCICAQEGGSNCGTICAN